MSEMIERVARAICESERNTLRKLVDLTWNHVTESQEVPSTDLADELIDRAFAAAQLPSAQKVKEALLRRARHFVADAGCDEDDNEVNQERDKLIKDIDAALSTDVKNQE